MVGWAAGGMNWFVDTRAFARGDPRLIGPGRLVLVVGPSGAGKDTLIGGDRSLCAGDPGVVFPRRVVTRPPCSAEDNDCMSVGQFDRAQAHGSFALWWAAHGNKYGIPVSIDADIRAGRTVVCNTSRTILVEARRRYANVMAVLVTAPPDVLAARLAGAFVRGTTLEDVLEMLPNAWRIPDDPPRYPILLELPAVPTR